MYKDTRPSYKYRKKYIPGNLSPVAVQQIVISRSTLGRPLKTPSLETFLHRLPGWPKPRLLTYKQVSSLLRVAVLDTAATMRLRNSALWLAAWTMHYLYAKDAESLGGLSHGKAFKRQCFRDLEARDFTSEEFLEKLHSLQS